MLNYLTNQSASRLVQNKGCTESQILVLSKRVVELTKHLQKHPRDYASILGLKQILGKRKRLLVYLKTQDLWKHNQMFQFLKKLDS